MAAVCSRISSKFLPRYVVQRGFRMSAQLRAEKVMEELKEKNPYYEKYASKIAALQKTSPEEFLSRVDAAETKKKKDAEPQRKYSELLNPKEKLANPTAQPTDKKLNDILKLDMIKDKTAEEIKHLWYEYHRDKDVVAAAIPIEQYDTLMKNGKTYPIFIFPLPRSEGYEFIMLQFSGTTVHFTPLIAYQVHKENAPECLNIVHYTELRDKGIVLMRGEYDNQVVNPQEAQCLANQLQLYYCKADPRKIELLEAFNKRPDSFKHVDLIKEMENIKLE